MVFEVTSKKTRKQDLTKKFEIYRDVLRVREYFLFDPFEEYLDPSLQGYRLVDGNYEPIAMVKGGMPSEVLGLRAPATWRGPEVLSSRDRQAASHAWTSSTGSSRSKTSPGARRKWPVARRKSARREAEAARLRGRSRESSVCVARSKSCVGDCRRDSNECSLVLESLLGLVLAVMFTGRGPGRPGPRAPPDQAARARRGPRSRSGSTRASTSSRSRSSRWSPTR